MNVNTFYCSNCDNYTTHMIRHVRTLYCVICDNNKTCSILENLKDNGCSCIYIYDSNHNKIILNNECKKCFNGHIEYTSALFNYNINGINQTCIDNNRPLCRSCHMEICNKQVHMLCEK